MGDICYINSCAHTYYTPPPPDLVEEDVTCAVRLSSFLLSLLLLPPLGVVLRIGVSKNSLQ
jgi:hypothetical protein